MKIIQKKRLSETAQKRASIRLFLVLSEYGVKTHAELNSIKGKWKYWFNGIFVVPLYIGYKCQTIFFTCSNFRALIRSKVCKWPTHALRYLWCVLFTIFSPTCFGRYSGHFQHDVILAIKLPWRRLEYRPKQAGEDIVN